LNVNLKVTIVVYLSCIPYVILYHIFYYFYLAILRMWTEISSYYNESCCFWRVFTSSL